MNNLMGQSMVKVFLFNAKQQFKYRWKKFSDKTHDLLSRYIPVMISGIKHYADMINFIYSCYGNIIVTIGYIIGLLTTNYVFCCTMIWLCCIGFNLVAGYLKIEHDKFYLTQDYSKLLNELDKLISDCLTEYAIFDGYDGSRYIDNKEEEKIKENISTMVSARISQTMLDKLSVAYNPDSVYTLIAARISIIILSYVVDNNRSTTKTPLDVPTNNTTSTIPFMMDNI